VLSGCGSGPVQGASPRTDAITACRAASIYAQRWQLDVGGSSLSDAAAARLVPVIESRALASRDASLQRDMTALLGVGAGFSMHAMIVEQSLVTACGRYGVRWSSSGFRLRGPP
jgi:hypothetical protein